MSDDKQPWPAPDDIFIMSTKARNEMTRFINTLAHGIGLKHRLELAYKAGWRAREAEIPKETTNENKTE